MTYVERFAGFEPVASQRRIYCPLCQTLVVAVLDLSPVFDTTLASMARAHILEAHGIDWR